MSTSPVGPLVMSLSRLSICRSLSCSQIKVTDCVDSLHDVLNHPVSTPLVINLPAYPTQDIADVNSYLPSFLRQYPTATIHYRWSRNRDSEAAQPPAPDDHQTDVVQPIPTPLQWPTPVTDILVAYDFLRKALSPSSEGGGPLQRRDIYVHGSYLGASLAVSLALTETHVHEPVAIRGLSAYNGIYNWTTFLPNHALNRPVLTNMFGVEHDHSHNRADEDVAPLRHLMPTLFRSPADMFDPFVSPVLFFHTSGLMVPPSFTERWEPLHLSSRFLGARGDIDPYDYVYSDPEDPPPPDLYPEVAEMEVQLGEDLDASDTSTGSSDINIPLTDESLSSTPSSLASATTTSTVPKPTANPRKGYLAFPPRWSNLKIPDTLLLHSTAPPLPSIPSYVVSEYRRVALWKKLKNAENSFGTQALGLGSLMRRSVDKFELKERMRWDEEFGDWNDEAAKRVRIEDTGGGVSCESKTFGFGKEGQAEEIAAQWFEERVF